MKYAKLFSTIGILSIAAVMAGCEGKKKKAKILTTTTQIIVDKKGTTAGGAALTTTVSAGSYTISLTNGLIQTTTPTGDFTGITYTGDPAELAGFVGQVPTGSATSSSTLGSSLISTLGTSAATNNLANSNAVTIISSADIAKTGGGVTIYHLTVTTDSATNVTTLSNLLLQTIGLNKTGGTVTGLPTAGATESTATTFHVVMQVVYSTTCPSSLGIGVSTTPNYSNTEAVLSGFLDGTNVSCGTVTKDTKTDSLTGASDPKADFVWVIDNSGSMSTEQAAVQSAASSFFTALSTKKLDYQIKVITTDSATLRNAGGSDTITSSTANGQTVFNSNVAAGTGGSGTESAIHFSQVGIANSVLSPRSGSKLFFVFLTDEGDHYSCYNGGTVIADGSLTGPLYNPCNGGTAYNTSSNIFTQNGYKVYGIMGVNASTGNAGTCTGSGATAAASNNNTFPQYQQLITATGGSMASICSSDFSPIMTSIVSQAAGSASPYVLSKTPISSTIVVKVKGVQVANSASNGWVYDATANAISFAGAATPVAGDAVTVTYEYNTSATAMNAGSNQTLTAFIGNASSEEVGKFALGALLLAGIALAGRSFFSRKK